jgi:hypothetical protein
VTFNNKISPKKIKIIKQCVFCKKDFSNKHTSTQIHCSQKCSNDHKTHTIETEGFPNCWNANKRIRKYLVEKHGNNCMICGQSGDNWNGKPMTLIVDHIDGKSNNNQLDNLRIVCPNCDSQLPTYKGRNRGNSSRSYFIVQKPK